MSVAFIRKVGAGRRIKTTRGARAMCFASLAHQKESKVEEEHLMPDYVHTRLLISSNTPLFVKNLENVQGDERDTFSSRRHMARSMVNRLSPRTSVRAEVGAAKTMLDRTAEQFDLTPSRLVADGGYGSAEMVGWPVDERGIEPRVNLIDKSERPDGTFSREPTSHSIPNATSRSAPGAKS